MTAAKPVWFGLLNLNKPAGVTSRDVVNIVQRLVRPAKAGHAGTLDPLAEGVLIVCVGPATRLVPAVQELDKEYRATFVLGSRSATHDTDSEVTVADPQPSLPGERIAAELQAFVGTIDQVPPEHSAVHVGGVRAYRLARAGKAVEIAARPVTVYSIDVRRYESPELELQITCGSGTYIRSIARDLGERLGCGCVMSRLIRTRIGPFRIGDATPAESLDRSSLSETLLPARIAVAHWPAHTCTVAELAAIRCGRAIPAAGRLPEPGRVALSDPAGNLVALAEPKDNGRLWQPRTVFPESPSGQ